MQEYGPKDLDTAPYDKLLTLAADHKIIYILHHARVDAHAKLCQKPGSLKVQAVLAENKTITVVKLATGEFLITRNW